MTYNNEYIAAQFSLLSRLMDIHNENSFRSKTYSNAAFVIDKLPVELTDMSLTEITVIKGIGDTVAKKIAEIQASGTLEALQKLANKTPSGIFEMMQIKGLGPKKIATIWKEMEIESLGELLYACHENRLQMYKGFGEKTQQQVIESIEFYFKNQGSYLYAEVESLVDLLQQMFTENFPHNKFSTTGSFRRQDIVITSLEWVTDLSETVLHAFLEERGFRRLNDNSFVHNNQVNISFHFTTSEEFGSKLFTTTGCNEFVKSFESKYGKIMPTENESLIFQKASLPFIHPCRREYSNLDILIGVKELIAPINIKGIIHCHSKWSDGSHSLRQMAESAKSQGFEYLVISDHSQSAFYANGLKPDRIRAQQDEIDELNKELAPFFIFKSIECDILNDGSLDYSDDILSSFDCIIASVHSHLKMTEEKAMTRLLGAIQNKHTTILGHATGRLLLSRQGYPVDHKVLIDACAAHQVAIEINAHPRRLDIDWKWIPYCLEKNVLLSINPDAHHIDGFQDIKYGVLAAQKGGLTSKQNLSSFSLSQFTAFIEQQKIKRNG
jgi:DNA polymerase (family 10)